MKLHLSLSQSIVLDEDETIDKKLDIVYNQIKVNTHLYLFIMSVVSQDVHEETNVINNLTWGFVKSNSKMKNVSKMIKKTFVIKCFNRFEALNDYSSYEVDNELDKIDQVSFLIIFIVL